MVVNFKCRTCTGGKTELLISTNSPKVLEESNSSTTNETCSTYQIPKNTCPTGVYNFQTPCVKFCGNQ